MRLRSTRSACVSTTFPALSSHVEMTCTLISESSPTFSTSPTMCQRLPSGLKWALEERSCNGVDGDGGGGGVWLGVAGGTSPLEDSIAGIEVDRSVNTK